MQVASHTKVRPRVESLEDRNMPSAVTEFTTGITAASSPTAITPGGDGNLWFTEFNVDRIGRITPAGAVSEFTLPAGRGPLDIVPGPDGNIYFTERFADRIGRLNPAAGSNTAIQASIIEFSGGITAGSGPTNITTGPDGNLWFTEFNGDRIGRITIAGTVTEFGVPGAGSGPAGITAGPDSAMWFTEAGSGEIGRITTAGVVTNEFPLAVSTADPEGITTGADGALWFTKTGSDEIGRITTAGTITSFPLPTGSIPSKITRGPLGALYFNESGLDRIGRITTAGIVTAFGAGQITPGSQPTGITLFGSDVWFTENAGNNIGRLAPEVAAGQALAISGRPDGTTLVSTPDPLGQYPTAPVPTLSPFGNTGTDLRSTVGDVNGDGIEDTILVTGPGTAIRFAVVSGADNATVLVGPTDPFGGGFTGGGFIASADVDRDGRAEIIITPDRGGGPRVSIFTVLSGGLTTRANFLGIDDANFRGGARAALGDVNRDGAPDLAVSAGFLGGPRTALFDGRTLFATPTRLIGDFFAFPGSDATTLRNGVFVAEGDVNGDGFADLIFGGGPGGAARVFILSGAMVSTDNVAGAQANPVANFFVAGNASDRGGIRVATKDADSDTLADVVAGSGEGSVNNVRVYLGKSFTGSGEPGSFQDFSPYGGVALTDGVFVG